jgi:transposase
MKAYSLDLRQRVVAVRGEGATIEQTAVRLGVSPKTVSNYCRLERETGGLAPGQHGGYKISRLADYDETLRQWIAKEPELTLDQLCRRIKRRLKITIRKTALDFRLKKLGLRFKKNAEGRRTRAPAGEGSTPMVEAKPGPMGSSTPGFH